MHKIHCWAFQLRSIVVHWELELLWKTENLTKLLTKKTRKLGTIKQILPTKHYFHRLCKNFPIFAFNNFRFRFLSQFHAELPKNPKNFIVDRQQIGSMNGKLTVINMWPNWIFANNRQEGRLSKRPKCAQKLYRWVNFFVKSVCLNFNFIVVPSAVCLTSE